MSVGVIFLTGAVDAGSGAEKGWSGNFYGGEWQGVSKNS